MYLLNVVVQEKKWKRKKRRAKRTFWMIQTMFVNSFFLVNCVTFDYLRQSLTTVSVYSLVLYHGICKALKTYQ